MGGFSKFNGTQHVVFSSIFCTFSLSAITPQPAYAVDRFINNINLGVKIQKLCEKAIKFSKKLDADNLLDIVLEIKAEIEKSTGQKINIEKEIDKVEAEYIKKGGMNSKNVFKQYKNLLKNKAKKKHARNFCMENYFYDSPEMTFEEYESTFLSQKPNVPNNDLELLPLNLFVGITLMLGGAFVLFASPICPALVFTGEMMMTTGFGFLTMEGLDYVKNKNNN